MGKTIKNFGVDFNEIELANRVKLYSFYKPNSPVYFRVYFYAGSQFDGDKPGLAHFCEHILMSGTEKYPTRDILSEKIEELGASRNAFTGRKNLWLTFNLADKTDLPDLFEIVDQILNKSIFADETIEKERGAILAEQTRSLSNPDNYINSLQGLLMYQGTNIENPILGFNDVVKKISRTDLLDYKNKYLINGQVAYFIAGDFDEKLVTNFLNKINNNRQPIGLVEEKLPIIKDKKELFKIITNPEQNYLSLVTRMNPIMDKTEQVSSDIFNMVFGQGNTSRLFKKLRVEKGLVYGVNSNFTNCPEFGSFGINTNCKVGDTKEVINTIKEEFNRIINQGVNDKELERAKKSLWRNLKFNSESASFFVQMGVMREMTGFPDSPLPDEYVDLVKTITVEKVNSFIKKYLVGQEFLLAGIGDFKI